MGPEMKLFIEVASKIFEARTPICELGSFQIPEGFADLRPFFREPYIGLDMRRGPGVDVMGSAEYLPIKNECIGTLVSVATLEHVENPIKAVDEIYQALRRGGVIILTSVFNFPIHDYPSDFWRFTPECFNLLLNNFDCRIIYSLGPSDHPNWVMGMGFKSNSGRDTAYYRAKVELLHQMYLRKLSELEIGSLKTKLLKRVLLLPGLAKYRGLFAKNLEMEFSATLYHGETRCSLFRTKLG